MAFIWSNRIKKKESLNSFWWRSIVEYWIAFWFDIIESMLFAPKRKFIWWACCAYPIQTHTHTVKRAHTSTNCKQQQPKRCNVIVQIEIEAWIKAVLVSYNSKMCKKRFFFFPAQFCFSCWCFSVVSLCFLYRWKKSSDFCVVSFAFTYFFLWDRNCLVDYICFSNWYIVTCVFSGLLILLCSTNSVSNVIGVTNMTYLLDCMK